MLEKFRTEDKLKDRKYTNKTQLRKNQTTQNTAKQNYPGLVQIADCVNTAIPSQDRSSGFYQFWVIPAAMYKPLLPCCKERLREGHPESQQKTRKT